jgi:predicted nucleic acid-binding protein
MTSYSSWLIIEIGAADVMRASELEERYHLSFWDALIVTAAEKGGAEELLTEDLSHGQRLSSLIISNPFV